jgi:hypothetical protein
MQASAKHNVVIDCSQQLADGDSGGEVVPCRPSAMQHANLELPKYLSNIM